VDGYENLSVFDYIFLYAMPENGDTVYKPSKYLDDSLMAQSLFYDTLYKPNYTFVNGIAPIWIGPESNCRYEYENGKWGYITKKGSWIVEPICDIGRFPSEGYLIVEQDLMLKYYDIINKRFITTPYNFGNTFNEGLSCVSIIDDTLVQYIANIGLENEGKWGYLNKKLKEVIPLKFDLAYSFSNDYAVVFKNHKYGFIDKRGNLRIKYQFNAVTDFVDNRAGARKDSLYGIIDKNGNWIKKPIYDRLFNYSYKMAVASFYNKIGFVDLDGDWVISPEFDYARPFCDANAKNCIDCLSPVRFYEPLIEIEIPLPPDPDF